MTREELELLAGWLGLTGEWHDDVRGFLLLPERHWWNPETNDTDFLNMVAGRVDIDWLPFSVVASIWDQTLEVIEAYDTHNNSEYLAMKHAGIQVCLMAAKEWKEGKE